MVREMLVEKTCAICGCKFTVPQRRKDTAKYCSPSCRQEGLKAANNAVCTTCGKPFHLKKYQMERYNRTMGFFCCRECARIARVDFMSGDGNHQYGLRGGENSSFKGEEIPHKNNSVVDIMVYMPQHPRADKNGRVAKHRLVVEQNASLFGLDFFDFVNGFLVLKDGYIVHHKDGDHDNNNVENLEVLTRGEHSSIHNKLNTSDRDNTTGRFKNRKYDIK